MRRGTSCSVTSGDLRFEEIGETAGVAFNGSGRATASMGVVADDLDGDGRIDLFITNLVNESSTFFRNLGGGLFVDATLGAGLDAPSRPKTGFGVAALDADGDGRLDLFVANGHVDDRPWANSRMAQSALFFWGRDGGRFDVAARPESSYFARAVVGRGVAAGDLNNDGRVDLVVVHRDQPAALLVQSRPRQATGWASGSGNAIGKDADRDPGHCADRRSVDRAVADERHGLSLRARSAALVRAGRFHERPDKSR